MNFSLDNSQSNLLEKHIVDRPKSIRHSGAVAARSALRNQSYPLIQGPQQDEVGPLYLKMRMKA